MKNKSKLKKMQKEKKTPLKVPAEWLYLCSREVSLRDIYEIFGKDTPWNAELWEEAGALEIGIPEAGAVDMECMDMDPGDEAGNAYLEEHQVKTVFAVTVVPDHYEKAHEVMVEIMEKVGGFFCGDTEDFRPEVRLAEKEG